MNILIPTIDLEHFFGGYITKLNLARRLAERGARVRIVTVDPVGVLPAGWRRTLESYSGLDGLFDRVEVVFGRESQGIEVSRSDRFVATTWWTAHVAAAALEALGGGRFLYLIQEYEPFTFPMGSYAALASESYRLPAPGALLERATARLLPPPRARGLRGGRGRRGLGLRFQNAITADRRRPPPPSSLRAAPAVCSSTRGPSRTRRATCSSSACSL